MYSCHQQPDRSFWIFGYPMALCCRCLGTYIGVAITSVLALINKFSIGEKAIIIIAILAFADIFINYGMGKLQNTGNVTRFIAGILLAIVITKVFDYILKTERK